MSEFRLNSYHIMWLFVFFDLPTTTKTDRKNAALFRKNLEKDGFSMMQFSVYARNCPSRENLEVHENRIRLALPPAGNVSMMSITDRQFAEIRTYYGKIERAKPDMPQQLELF